MAKSKKAKIMEKEQSLDERVLLGHVGVDSGQLMVCDPCYLESEWQKEKGDDVMDSISDLSQFKDKATGVVFSYPFNWTAPYPHGDGKMNFNEAYKNGLFTEHIPDHLIEQAKEFSYVGCCANTIHGFGGQLHYTKGHAGAGVVFSSGLGDGFYEVWATIGEVKGWGKRVKKVEIILVDEDEMNEG
jgi:hypothetical protein